MAHVIENMAPRTRMINVRATSARSDNVVQQNDGKENPSSEQKSCSVAGTDMPPKPQTFRYKDMRITQKATFRNETRKEDELDRAIPPALVTKNRETTAGELISEARHARSPLAPWDNDVADSEASETSHLPKDPSVEAAPRASAHSDLPTMQQLKAVRHRQANEIKQKEAVRQGRQISPSSKGSL